MAGSAGTHPRSVPSLGSGVAAAGGVLTLYDMLRFQFDAMLQRLTRLPQWSVHLSGTPAYPGEPSPKAMTAALLSSMERDLEEYGLHVTKDLVTEMLMHLGDDWPDVSKEDWDRFSGELASRLESESKKRLFFLIPADRQSYYVEHSWQWPFLEIELNIPSAKPDLTSASRCLAFGEATACVFHAMRAAESAVRILARNLGFTVTDKGKPLDYLQFGAVIGEIKKKVDAIRNETAGPEKAAALSFYQESALQLERAKDAWRDDGVHGRRDFEISEAIEIYTATRELLRSLVNNGLYEER